jgi:aspartate aminotransferase-like enzyme/phosphoglycerate dehydrogenase-like enzyme
MNKDKYPSSETLIFTGDISNIPPVTSDFTSENYVHHRSLEFGIFLDTISTFFKKIFGSHFIPLALTTTYKGVMEALITNTLTDEDVVFISRNSKLEKIIHPYTKNIYYIDELKSDVKPSLIILEAVEPSGSLTNLEKISKCMRLKYPGTLIAADLSQVFSIDHIVLEDVDVDAFIVLPERGLMGIPGVSFLIVNKKFSTYVKEKRRDLFFVPYAFDLIKYENAWSKKHTTPYSPDISATIALSKSIEFIEGNGGITEHIQRHKIIADIIRSEMIKMGFNIVGDSVDSSNSFSRFKIPKDFEKNQICSQLIKKNILISGNEGSDIIEIGHVGYLTFGMVKKLLESIAAIVKHKTTINIKDEELLYKNSPPLGSFKYNEYLAIPAKEFLLRSNQIAERSGGSIAEKIKKSSASIFRENYNTEDVFPDRTVGFIGSGNTVKQTVDRFIKIGVKDIIIFSPQLAECVSGLDNVKENERVKYWVEKGVRIAHTAREVYLTAHTVILLPLLHDQCSIEMFNLSEEYINLHMINGVLLEDIKNEGKMDVLINAAARNELVDHSAVAQSIQDGWLKYYSDELPSKDNPLLAIEETIFTGHVGGSTNIAQNKLAENTHLILRNVIHSLVSGKQLLQESEGYKLNIINERLKNNRVYKPRSGKTDKVRVLLTDIFNLEILDFSSLEKLGAQIEIKDVSDDVLTSEKLEKIMREFKPHVLLIRSKKEPIKNIVKLADEIEDFSYLIRPGVGIDNIHPVLRGLDKRGVIILNEPNGNISSVAEMCTHFLLNSVKNVILAPGPTNYNKKIFDVFSRYTHPKSEFCEKNKKYIRAELKKWLVTKRNPIIVSGPSTVCMEASIRCGTKVNDRGLVIVNGKFGERFNDICQNYRRRVEFIGVHADNWGEAVKPEDIEKFITQDDNKKSEKLSFVCFQQNETSSGVAYHPEQMESIIEILREYNPDITIIMDAVSGTFAHDIRFDELDVDVQIIGSQKGLGVSSGLTYVTMSDRYVQKMLSKFDYKHNLESFIKDHERERLIEKFSEIQKVSSLNLLRHVTDVERGEGEEVISVFHIISSAESLRMMDLAGGRKICLEKNSSYSEYVKSQAEELGLEFFSDKDYLSDTLTALKVPSNVDASILKSTLQKEYGIIIAGAQADIWKSSLIRIGNIGFVTKSDLFRCMRCIRILLNRYVKKN